MKSAVKFLAPLAVTATLLSSAPASALSSWCATDAFPAFITQCTAQVVPANSDGHFIYFGVSAWAGYRLRDTGTGVFIRAGNTGGGDHTETVFGLYGWYELQVQGIACFGYISNT